MVATHKIYRLLREETKLKNSQIEKRAKLGNATIRSAETRKSIVTDETLDKLSTAFPELDIKSLAARSHNENAPLAEEQGALKDVEAAWLRIDTAVQAAVEAARAATKMADALESRLMKHEARFEENEASLRDIQVFFLDRIAAIEKRSPQALGEEMGTWMIENRRKRKTGS